MKKQMNVFRVHASLLSAKISIISKPLHQIVITKGLAKYRKARLTGHPKFSKHQASSNKFRKVRFHCHISALQSPVLCLLICPRAPHLTNDNLLASPSTSSAVLQETTLSLPVNWVQATPSLANSLRRIRATTWADLAWDMNIWRDLRRMGEPPI